VTHTLLYHRKGVIQMELICPLGMAAPMPEALLSLKPQGEEFLQLYIQTLSANEPMPSGDSPPIVIVEERAASSEEVSRLEKKPCPEGESFKIGEPATPRADLMPEAANMILALLPSGSERQDGINTP